jgi:hypothetical protein
LQSSGGKAGAESVRAALAAALSAQPLTPAIARTLETQPGAVLQVSECGPRVSERRQSIQRGIPCDVVG